MTLNARFAVNLRNDTVSPAFRRALRPWGYLVPPSSLTASLRKAVFRLVAKRTHIIVDNGLFDDVRRLANSHADEAMAVAVALAGSSARLNRPITWADLKVTEQRAISRLAEGLSAGAASAQGMSLQDQLGLRPTGIVGTEDITAATWLRAGLDVAILGPRAKQLKQRNVAVAARARVARGSLATRRPPDYLPVASALDYDTAFDAGKIFAASGCSGVAMGFGAFMADDSLSDKVIIRGRTKRLSRNLPMRYVRTALVARGFWDGWRHVTGGAPARFHFLGLGSPIMMAVAAVAASGTPLVTFDATSPVRDAVEGTMYSALGAYLKIRTRRLAARMSSGVLNEWTCPCGFCRAFVRAHPFNYPKGRVWGARHRITTATARDLAPNGGLYSAYPLFSEPRGGALRAAVSFARSGHNHWVLDEVVGKLRRHGRTSARLEKHVKAIVEAYQRSTSAEYIGQAVALAFEIAAGRGVL